MKIKYFILSVLLLLSVIVFSQRKISNNIVVYPLKITLQDLEKNKIFYSKSHTRNLRIKITNNADTTFSFWIMSCSWQGCVSFNPNIGYIDFEGCDKNIPQKIILKPDSSFSLDANYKLNGSVSNAKPIKLSVGFRTIVLPDSWSIVDEKGFVKIDEFLSFFDYNSKYSRKGYIWSKPITISF